MRPYAYLDKTLEALGKAKSEAEKKTILKAFAGMVENVGTIQPKNERELLIVRLNTIKAAEQYFPSSVMRWKFIKYKDKHVRDIDPTTLTDSELVEFFEIILRQYYKQF